MKQRFLKKSEIPPFALEFFFLFILVCVVLYFLRYEIIRNDHIQDVYIDHGIMVQPQYENGQYLYKIAPEIRGILFDDTTSKSTIVSTLQKVLSYHPRVVAVDYRFNAENKSAEDSLLIKWANTDKIILAYDISDTIRGRSYFCDNYENAGYTNFEAVRQIEQLLKPYYIRNGRKHAAFATRIAEQYLKQPVDYTNDILIDFEYNLDYTHFSLLDEGDYKTMKNRIIILGEKSSFDLKRTPYGDMPGVKIHGFATATLLNQILYPKEYQDILTGLIYIFMYLLVISELRWILKRHRFLEIEDLLQIVVMISMFMITSIFVRCYNLYTLQFFAIPFVVTAVIFVYRKICFLFFRKHPLQSLWLGTSYEIDHEI